MYVLHQHHRQQARADEQISKSCSVFLQSLPGSVPVEATFWSYLHCVKIDLLNSFVSCC